MSLCASLGLVLATLALLLLLVGASSAAPLRPGFDGVSDTPSSVEPHWACPRGLCDAIGDPRPARGEPLAAVYAGHEPEGGGKLGGYDPEDLRSAYDIPATGGAGQTIAVVEGFVYKQAEKDLAEYRSHYGLPACTSKGGCLKIVNGKGETPHYSSGSGWELEVALDLDMASAACPECHLLLLDAEEENWDALGTAVDRAAALGATEISNSYGLPEETCTAECSEAAGDFDHPGLFVSVSAGDYGWDNTFEGAESPSYPSDQPTVAAIGGTALRRSKSHRRPWSERVWGERGLGTGSGCTLMAKPAWQHDGGCPGRTDNDVSAVGACATPVSVYSSPEGGWEDVCGTSVSSPLVAGIEAHATPYSRSLPGGEAFYEGGVSLFDVKGGNNGKCAAAAVYLCHATVGYDGPTGNGTPDGPLLLEP
jgi:subtilase family serine protease